MPPFTPATTRKHSKASRSSPKAQRAGAAAAESVYAETGDEGRAIAAGNAAVNKSLAKTKREKGRKGS
jgi:hypothetical protein